MLAALRRVYHALVPLGLRRALRVSRFSPDRRARANLWTKTGGRVAAGPFAGLRLAGNAPDDCYGPILIGSYECEVHEWLERELRTGWPAMVNIKSNAGFYSTGLALRTGGEVRVHAFEADAAMRAETARSATINGVHDRVQIHGPADIPTLSALESTGVTRALVVCDCEGMERELLDPSAVSWLGRSALCVELHDFAAPGVTDLLRTRFGATHRIQVLEQRPRDPVAWAARVGVSVEDAQRLTEELRPWAGANLPGRWLVATPATAGRA
ncbi:MAG: hypothetical protein FJ202_00055 [Gemmatimonadetes bacterium]|nr:hypothetical protein [Gemmatimonadota bacterium]